MKAVKQVEKDSYLDMFFVINLAEMNDPLTNHLWAHEIVTQPVTIVITYH
jgi:hypothetical protein